MGYFSEKTKERDELIIEAVKQYEGLVTSKEIAELTGISRSVVKSNMSRIMKENPNIKAIPKKGYIYSEKKSKKSEMKNLEGYSDPTAGKAIANAMMSKNEVNQIPGEIWVRETGSYSKNNTELALVIGASKGVINYIPVKDFFTEKEYYFEEHCTNFLLPSGTKVYVDYYQVRVSGQNSFERGKYECLLDPDIYQEILDRISERFNISRPKEIIKEVPVYEVKEVPVEITQDSAIDFLVKNGWLDEYKNKLVDNVKKTVESNSEKLYSAYKAKAEAWESAFRLMCGKEQ